MSEQPSLLLLGAGPIGLTAAAEASRGATHLRCIAPNKVAPWGPNYGIWQRDASRLHLTSDLRHAFDEVTVRFASGRERRLPLGYAFLDNSRLQQRLLQASAPHWESEEVLSIADAPTAATVTLRSGVTRSADLILDARGASALSGAAALPAQTAFGVEIALPAHHAGLPFCFMDWSFATPAGEPPSFLYALPRGGGRLFVEETVLSATPAFPIERLRGRLQARLATLGLGDAAWIEGSEEHCYIPMGAPPPVPGGRLIPLGAAAGWVHPASGYLLGHGLGWAADVGRLAGQGATVDALWEAAWPSDRRRRWALYRFGLDLLLRLDREQTSAFFEEFFDLPEELVQDYLSATGSASQLASTMWRLFSEGSWPLKRRLAAAGLRPAALRLVRDLAES